MSFLSALQSMLPAWIGMMITGGNDVVLGHVSTHRILYAITGVAGCIIAQRLYTNRYLPPGPWGFPIVGVLPLLSDNIHTDCVRWSRKYGDIVSLYFGNTLVVILNTRELIKEAFLKRGTDFADRPSEDLFEVWFGYQDVIFYKNYSEDWAKTKKLLINSARVFGYGQGKQATRIAEEANRLVGTLKTTLQSTGDSSMDLKPYLCWGLYNVISRVLFNHGDSYEDEHFLEFLHTMDKWSRNIQVAMESYYIPFSSWMSRAVRKEGRKNTEVFKNFIFKHLDHHLATFDPSNIRDVTDFYIKESGGSVVDRQGFFGFIIPFIPDSIYTAPHTLHWLLAFMAKHKDVQRKVHAEIDDVTGCNRQPNIEDKPNLPYTRATISEVMRLVPLVPLGFPHRPRGNTTLSGYRIPQDAHILPNIYACHRNPDVWDNPDCSNPSRFLDQDGKNEGSDGILTFSIGTRRCPGESLVRLEFFIFFTILMYHFDVDFDGPSPSMDMNDHKEGQLSGAMFSLTDRGMPGV